MALLQLSSFSLSVGSTQLLDSVDAAIASGQRVGLVGSNGAGKSTLMRALAHPDSPNYFMSGSGRVCGTLQDSQGVVHVEQDNLSWSKLLGVNDEDLIRSMTVLEALDLAACEENTNIVQRATEDAESWRNLTIAADNVLQWRTANYNETPIGDLSPGCAVRAYLAIALARPDIELMLLDEPTNHLDIPSMLWLERAIIASRKALIVISHDATFLDAVVDHIWAIDPVSHKLKVSGTSYSAFRNAEQISRDQQRVAFHLQHKRHDKLSKAAEKLKAASKAGSTFKAKDHDTLQRDFKRDRAGRSGGKAKALEAKRDAEDKVEKVVDRRALHINIEPLDVSTDSSILLKALKVGHLTEALPLPPLSLRIDFGEHIAIVGYNGIGKSTLLKTLTGAINAIDGEVCVGRELRIGNLTQEHETLPRELTPRAHVAKLMKLKRFDAGQALIRYGLTLRQVDCPIRELNPGARARVLLAIFSLCGVNTLILDEPTNHLDEEAVDEIAATLNKFLGTAIIVSHSRGFLESLHNTRTLVLSDNGLVEKETIDSFLDSTRESVDKVVRSMFQ